MEQILYGKPVAERLDEYSSKIFKTFESEQTKPKLTAITVGDNPASILYVSRKQEKAIKLGTVRADSVRWLGRINMRTSNGAGAIAKAQGQSHSIIGTLSQQQGCTRWVDVGQ